MASRVDADLLELAAVRVERLLEQRLVAAANTNAGDAVIRREQIVSLLRLRDEADRELDETHASGLRHAEAEPRADQIAGLAVPCRLEPAVGDVLRMVVRVGDRRRHADARVRRVQEIIERGFSAGGVDEWSLRRSVGRLDGARARAPIAGP
ncbi:MAG: hypothetical protein KF819_21795 [Labilithrix sp.]|nr:hypothetical protein [Labilithrix sp.]